MEGGKTIQISSKSIFYGLCIAVLMAAVYYIRDIVFVFLTSIVIASFVEAGVKRLAKRRIGRTISVVFIYFVALGALGTLFYFFVPVFLEEMVALQGLLNAYLPQAESLASISTRASFSDIIGNFSSLSTNIGGGVVQTVLTLFGGIFNFVLLVVLSFYLSINKDGIENFLRIVTPDNKEEYVVGLWKRTERKIGLWFQGQLLLGVLVGVLTYLGLLIFNIKYALLLALVAAVFELIPFGIILAAVPAVAAGYASSGGIGALEVAGLYVIIQQFENNLIQPLIIKKVVGISTLVVILSLLIGVKLAGFWGVMLAIPAAVLLMEILGDIEKRKAKARQS